MRDDAGHVRACFPFAEEIGLAIDICIVTSDVREPLLNTDDTNSSREQRLITANLNFVRITVIDDDTACRDSNRPQAADNFPDDLR